MGQFTNIAWTDSTLNTAWGCTKVSAGCQNCYMFRLSERFGRVPDVVTILRNGSDTKVLQKTIDGLGKRIFVNSMSDTFHESIPFDTIAEWFKVFSANRNHQFQILTKRTNRAKNFAAEWKRAGHEWPENIWLGTSVEDQGHVFRIKTLRETVGPKIKFISFEPLLGPISELDLTGIQWAIVGGESGPSSEHRPMNPAWANYIRHVCQQQNVAFFFKQMGGRGGDGAGGDMLYGSQYKHFPSHAVDTVKTE